MKENKLELAWAAGFFDGEGSSLLHCSVTRPKKLNGAPRSYYILRLTIAQVNPEPLYRFKSAVGGVGNITGPYQAKGNRKPHYQYGVSGSSAESVFDLIKPYLCSEKIEQNRKHREAYNKFKNDFVPLKKGPSKKEATNENRQ